MIIRTAPRPDDLPGRLPVPATPEPVIFIGVPDPQSSRPNTPRCGAWMPFAGDRCYRFAGHHGDHRRRAVMEDERVNRGQA